MSEIKYIDQYNLIEQKTKTLLDYYNKGSTVEINTQNNENKQADEQQKAETEKREKNLRLVVIKMHEENIDKKNTLIETMISVTQFVRE